MQMKLEANESVLNRNNIQGVVHLNKRSEWFHSARERKTSITIHPESNQNWFLKLLHSYRKFLIYGLNASRFD